MDERDLFRQEVREWLETHCPVSQRQPIVREEQIWAGSQATFPSADAQAWFEAMRDRGWTAPSWPAEYGGGGLDPDQARILEQEMARLRCRPPLYDMGLWMLGPALLAYGSPEQKATHLPRIVRGEVRWAQGYSEPGAGSDLASLSTRALDAGDHFVVSGTKIWTTRADVADWIFCLVRTDADAPKREGISFLLIDMHSQGVSTRPIALISGESEFCQTFFDEVKVPKANLVGELNEGWAVAKELLKHERKLMATMESITEKVDVGLVELAKSRLAVTDQGRLANADLRARLAEHLMQADALSDLNELIYRGMKAGQLNPALPLTLKYIGTHEQQRKDELMLEILGADGLSMMSDTPELDRMVRNWAYNKAHTIAGGTSEIQLNIIARRGLGLPE
ncbi:MAG: acyl-CoA dehydrogenase family protein [Luminiphilus sp.]|jgi:acyl-CoA dehydrogenase